MRSLWLNLLLNLVVAAMAVNANCDERSPSAGSETPMPLLRHWSAHKLDDLYARVASATIDPEHAALIQNGYRFATNTTSIAEGKRWVKENCDKDGYDCLIYIHRNAYDNLGRLEPRYTSIWVKKKKKVWI